MECICEVCGRTYIKYCSHCFVMIDCDNCGVQHIVTRNYYYTHEYFPCIDCKDIPYMLVQEDNPVFTYRRFI